MLTELAVRKLAPKSKGRIELWDDKLPGFGIRVSPTGTKSFVLMYYTKGRKRRMTLGRYPILSLVDARKLAMEALYKVARGSDPQGSRAGPDRSHKFSQVVDDFVRTHCAHHNKASTARETERLLRARFVEVWGNRDVREISKADVLKILDDVTAAGTPSAANHDLAAIRKFFNWCVQRGIVEVSPCGYLPRPAAVKSRERVLSDDEIGAVWKAAEQLNYPYDAVVRLLIITAQRRGEVVGLRWGELDLEKGLWTIPGERTKNKRQQSVPLSTSALHIITSLPRISDDLVFPARGREASSFSGFSKMKRQLDELSGITEWTLHDLRRTSATGLARLSVAPHVVERILGHVSETFGGVAGVYNRFQYLPEMREALERWAKHVESITRSAASRSHA